jgi:hypothetical protein
MQRFISATSGWRVGAVMSVLLVAALALPAVGDESPLPGSKNKNLTATAKYSASSEWQSDQGNVDFIAAKAFDGDLGSRWNSASGDDQGSWLAATWDTPVTINKVVMYERFGRVQAYTIQQLDANGKWVDAYKAQDATFDSTIKSGAAGSDLTFVVRLDKPIVSKGLKVVFDTVSTVPSIAELEAWNNPSGTVTGTVTDPAKKPIPGATITAGADSTVTDANGKYTLVTDAGKYNLTASKFGAFRNRVARAVDLPANGTATHDFVLNPLPPNLSLIATAVSSSDYQGGTDYNAAKANDGNPTTRWNSDSGDVDGAYLVMQWAQPQTFNKVTIREAIDRIRNYSLQTYDETKAAYVDIPGASNINVPTSGPNPILTNAFASPITTKRLRLLINHADEVPSVWELEVSNAPLGTVTGVVTDVATGQPVANATIISDLGAVLGTTDAKGQFSVLLDADDYVISATASSYFAGAPVAFTINGGDKQQVTLTAPAQGPDIAKTAAASASTEDPAYPASNVNDGDPTTYWLATVYNLQWVAVTWKQPTHFTVVQLRNFQGVIQSSYLQMLDKDGKTWVELPGSRFAPQFSQPDAFLFPDGITTTSLRYYITATHSTDNIPGLGEMLVYDSPIPKPAP